MTIETDPWVVVSKMINTMERLTGVIEMLTSAVRDVETRVVQMERRQAQGERITYGFNPPAAILTPPTEERL